MLCKKVKMKTYKNQEIKDGEYSLHDANIIDIYMDGDDLILVTSSGYVDLRENKQVDGNIRIKDISLEDSYVYLMEYKKVLCGNPGKFIGEKMRLKKFLKKFKKSQDHIDIIDEYHAYMTLSLGGFFTHKEKIKEIKLDLFYRGDLLYELIE